MDRVPESQARPARPASPERPARTPDLAWPAWPAWLYVLAGWLLASTQLSGARRSFDEREVRARAPFGVLDPPTADPDSMDPRELRRLPAIGPARALAIARARWEAGLSGGPEAWNEVPGIGPETVRSIRSAIEGLGKDP